MDVLPFFFFWVYFVTTIYATKEDASYGSSKSDARKQFIELIKRIGKNNGVDLDDLIRDEEIRGQCKTSETTKNSIIKSTDSIASGAKYVSSHKKIPSLTECSKRCCEDPDCDTAIYQDNKDQHCYLFACQGLCKFTEHSDYSVTVIEHLKPAPSQPQHEEEAQLENLHGNNGGAAVPEETAQDPDQDSPVQEEKIPTTVALTPPQKPYVAPHTAGLYGFCTSDVSCEDPNAGCFEEKCGCRQSYYNKAGLCRKVCPESHFECFKLGSLTRGPECVPRIQVCDSYMQCADGSDEFKCEDSDNQSPEMSHPDVTKNKDNSHGGIPEGPANPINPVPMKPRPPVKEGPVSTKTKNPLPVAQTSVTTQPVAAPHNKTSGASHNAKLNHTDHATSKPPHQSVGTKEQVFLSREKVIIASSSSEAEGPIIALSLGLAFTIILIGLLACRLRNMKHRLRKGRPLNSNEADYLINGMYL